MHLLNFYIPVYAWLQTWIMQLLQGHQHYNIALRATTLCLHEHLSPRELADQPQVIEHPGIPSLFWDTTVNIGNDRDGNERQTP